MSDKVLVDKFLKGRRTVSGIIIPDDNGKAHGVKPRWCRVYAKGSEISDDIVVGEWILVEHGRWTRALKLTDMESVDEDDDEPLHLWMVEYPASVLAIQTDEPVDETFGTYHVSAPKPPGM